jgi:hypothetical protein
MEFVRALSQDALTMQAVDVAPELCEDILRQGNGPKHKLTAADTVSNCAAETDTWTVKKQPPLPGDVLPGHDFVECQRSTPFMDQWKVRSPDGVYRLVKIIYGNSLVGDQLEETLARLQSLQHPALVLGQVVYHDAGRIVLLTDMIKTTLRDRAADCQSRQMPGIMRGELLDYLRSAAEALDYLYHQHSIQHLSLNPRNLLVHEDGRIQIAEFGLAQLLWLKGGQGVAQRNARYAAPELFNRNLSHACDQFSLALIYCEMLTGTHPLRSKGVQTPGAPNLARLPEYDRAVLTRALDPDPAKRWPSLMDMVHALEGTDAETLAREQPDRFSSLLCEPRSNPAPLPDGASVEDLNQIIRELVLGAGGEVPREENPVPILDNDILHYRFQAGLPLGSARLKLDRFGLQWYAQLRGDGEQGCVFHLPMPANFWQQWIGRQPGLEVRIRLARVQPQSATPIEVTVEMRAFRCSKRRGMQLLNSMGPSILDSLRNHLLINAEKRLHDRLLWPHALDIRPLDKDGKPGAIVTCRGKDISLSGLGFYLPQELDTSEVIIELPNSLHPPTTAVPATLVRAKRCADGWYDVGALFRVPALRKSTPEMYAMR